MRACKSCMRITEEEKCPVCKSQTTQYWGGYVAVLDPENSEIAKRLKIKTPGQYALKVR
ncbi:MAG TPA: DNA-directed RNA polymerase, subunit E'' [Candidatus Altiarchaeales archaeon]|nr:DNA-directed RNA polymerase, subunit E'' [Candidatus Altiarchaeales archaeon]